MREHAQRSPRGVIFSGFTRLSSSLESVSRATKFGSGAHTFDRFSAIVTDDAGTTVNGSVNRVTDGARSPADQRRDFQSASPNALPRLNHFCTCAPGPFGSGFLLPWSKRDTLGPP